MKQTPSIRITLTPEQQAQVHQVSGRQVAVLTLKPEHLEPRIAPGLSMN